MRVWRKYKKNLDIREETWIFRSISKFSLLKPFKRTRGVPEIYRWCISCRSCQALQNGFQYSNWKNWRRSRQERTLWKKCYTCSVMPKFISLTMTEYCILMIWPWAEPNSKQDVWIESVYSGRWPAPVQGRDLFPRAAPSPPQPASLPNEVCSDLLAIVCVCWKLKEYVAQVWEAAQINFVLRTVLTVRVHSACLLWRVESLVN